MKLEGILRTHSRRLAVLVAELSGVQHSFWVVFGTLAVLRSSAVLTGPPATARTWSSNDPVWSGSVAGV